MNYILCNGEQKRWEADLPKQLIKINGEMLLHRICGQFDKSTIVGHNKELQKGMNDYCVWIGADKTQSTLHTWDMIFTEGGQRILLGDVYYSDALARVIKGSEKTEIFGNRSEIFAVHIAKKDTAKARRALDDALVECETGQSSGKLWDWFKHFTGGKIRKNYDHESFFMVDDESQDFDRVDDIWLFYDKQKKMRGGEKR